MDERAQRSLRAGMTRRQTLAGAAGAALALAAGPAAAAKPGREGLSARTHPAWYGFNLLDYFSTDADWRKIFPGAGEGRFPEDDFRWARDWGFNFVRLPLDYRFWTDPGDLFRIREDEVEPLDRVLQLGERYGQHVSFALHRAPGYCVLDAIDQDETGIGLLTEGLSLWGDREAQDAFVHHWTYLAERYREVPEEKLSFELLSAPMVRIRELAALAGKNQIQPPKALLAGIETYVALARRTVDAIRSISPHRVVISDGYPGGGRPIPQLYDTGVVHSHLAYAPHELTLYRSEWTQGLIADPGEPPGWPVTEGAKVVFDRHGLADVLKPWTGLAEQGIPMHVSELGVSRHTPHDAALAWMGDLLDLLGGLGAGWALFNLRGPMGVLDSGRSDVDYESWYGHKLDRRMLTLLQKHVRV
jgi:endoglucanase